MAVKISSFLDKAKVTSARLRYWRNFAWERNVGK